MGQTSTLGKARDSTLFVKQTFDTLLRRGTTPRVMGQAEGAEPAATAEPLTAMAQPRARGRTGRLRARATALAWLRLARSAMQAMAPARCVKSSSH